ncbi:beta-1,3-glucan-binding protein [Elysia marginata]|uniref:Beta-1,3-glucan-binding protein n=1 Tax=Elysia marginata TaxID=1093978 RepID=A0AAV4G047_9GAST|nr:beta-1,3-glucan-binding protein [Elysia marginata]
MSKPTIRYGIVEVRARIPRGDWLWPCIWLMPKDNKYGAWPRSGEIDIMESRGFRSSTAAHRRPIEDTRVCKIKNVLLSSAFVRNVQDHRRFEVDGLDSPASSASNPTN